MTMSSVHHTGIIVKDLDRSIYFYHDVLGLEFANEPSPWFEGDALASAVGVPGAKLRQVSLWVGDNAILELLEYGNRPKDNDTPIQQNYLERCMSPSSSMTLTQRLRSSLRREWNSSRLRTPLMRESCLDGAGCISMIPTKFRSNSSRWRITTKKPEKLELRNT